MPTIVVRHKVGDFNTWIKGHEERIKLFASACSDFKTFQDKDDPNSIVMVMEVTDMDAFGKLVNDPALDEIKAKYTVLEPITVSMQVDV